MAAPPPTATDPLAAPPSAVPPPDTPSLRALLTLAIGVVIVAALYIGRDIFIPIVLAILLSFVLAPLVNLLRRLRLGRVPSVLLAVLLALGVIASIGGIIGIQVAQLAGDLPRYEATVTRKVGDLRNATVGRAVELLKGFDRRMRNAAEDPPARGDVPPAAGPGQEQRPLQVEVHQPALSSLELAQRVLTPVVYPLTTTGIVLIVAVFILMQREDLRDRLIRLFGASDLHRTTMAMNDAAQRLSTYFLTQLALNTAFGVLIAVGLWVIGVPSPLLWGIFAGLMRFVPYVGSFIAGAAPVLLAAAVDPGWSMALWTLALFAITEPLMGQVVEPMVYGHSTGMSPVAVVVAAIFWTWLWGPIGLLLATPFTVILVVLGRHVERLEFLDILFGDRPALTPVENFYQRVLAGDPDEALEHAELLLKERSLSSYYDEVALKGLQLAVNDARRGVVTLAQLDTIRSSIRDLVRDLAAHDDVEPKPDEDETVVDGPTDLTSAAQELPKEPPPAPPPEPHQLPPAWRAERAVLCIAGRGALDEAAAAMLAQLLQKHGVGGEAVPHEDVSRENLAGLDVGGVVMVCISYLEISGNPAHLRYLLRRLRLKLGNSVPLLVGLWPADERILTDEALRSQVGADHYVTTLRDAVKACLEEAMSGAKPQAAEPPPSLVPASGSQDAARSAAAVK